MWYLMFVCECMSTENHMPRAPKGKRVSDDASSISSASPKPAAARSRKRSRANTSDKKTNTANRGRRSSIVNSPAAAADDAPVARGSGHQSRAKHRPRRKRVQSLTGMDDDTGAFRYLPLTAAQMSKGEHICTHCNDHVSGELLHQHMIGNWDHKTNQWRTISSRDTRLPHIVPYARRPDIILGRH